MMRGFQLCVNAKCRTHVDRRAIRLEESSPEPRSAFLSDLRREIDELSKTE